LRAGLACIILAHEDPPQVRRLIAALAGADIFLHCDGRVPNLAVQAMLPSARAQGAVHLLPRRATARGSWSILLAELDALRIALERSRAEHIAVLSGSCYPLASLAVLQEDLAAWRGRSRLELNPLPYDDWNVRFSSSGGMWRLSWRYLTRENHIQRVFQRPIPLHPRRIPRDLAPHGSSHWKIYARHHAQALLRVLDEHPEQVRYWRHTFVPEELCAASILKSHALVGDIVDEVIDDFPWFIRWKRDSPHPRWLELDDYPDLEVARRAPARRPSVAVPTGSRDGYRKLFARKLRSASAALLTRIDQDLRAL
jgi:hypothetical protein